MLYETKPANSSTGGSALTSLLKSTKASDLLLNKHKNTQPESVLKLQIACDAVG